jgi:hypothetical protein
VRIGWENLLSSPEQSREQGQVARNEQDAAFPREPTLHLASIASSGPVPTPEREQEQERGSNFKPAAEQEVESEQHPEVEPEPEPESEPTFDIKGLAPEIASAVQYLREVPHFAKLTDAAMLHVAMQMQLLDFASQQVIVRKGDRGSTFYMITSGSVNVEQQGQRDLGARNCFEHAALLSENYLCPATATVTSDAGCTCYALDKKALDSAFSFQLLFPMMQAMLPMLFKEADEDRSGALDPAEVRMLINQLGFTEVPDHYITGIWNVFDADGDGVLDLEEVQEMVQVSFAFSRGELAFADFAFLPQPTLLLAQRAGAR